MSSWLSDREQMLVEGAEKNNLDLPIPTQIVSNGEYLPPKQSNLQKKVEPIDEADKVISELREAWAEMLTQNPDGRASGDQQSGSISLQA